jgi:hypothetical protein
MHPAAVLVLSYAVIGPGAFVAAQELLRNSAVERTAHKRLASVLSRRGEPYRPPPKGLPTNAGRRERQDERTIFDGCLGVVLIVGWLCSAVLAGLAAAASIGALATLAVTGLLGQAVGKWLAGKTRLRRSRNVLPQLLLEESLFPLTECLLAHVAGVPLAIASRALDEAVADGRLTSRTTLWPGERVDVVQTVYDRGSQ